MYVSNNIKKKLDNISTLKLNSFIFALNINTLIFKKFMFFFTELLRLLNKN